MKGEGENNNLWHLKFLLQGSIMKKILVIFLLSTFLFGCVSLTPEENKTRLLARAYHKITQHNDVYNGREWITSGEYKTYGYGANHWQCNANLYYSKINNIYMIQTVVQADDWIFLSDAWTISGTSLKLVNADTQVHYGKVFEYVNIIIDKSFLESRVNLGVDIKLFGKRGKAFVKIPAEPIEAFLMYLNGDYPKTSTLKKSQGIGFSKKNLIEVLGEPQRKKHVKSSSIEENEVWYYSGGTAVVSVASGNLLNYSGSVKKALDNTK